ncbi:MAG: hypothetical protein ACPGSG_00440 [Prolixibacteraceae bacterium]|jgi:hypothetical protein
MLGTQMNIEDSNRYDEGWSLLLVSYDKFILDEITSFLQDYKIISMVIDYGDDFVFSLGSAFLYVRAQDELEAKSIVEQYKMY